MSIIQVIHMSNTHIQKMKTTQNSATPKLQKPTKSQKIHKTTTLQTPKKSRIFKMLALTLQRIHKIQIPQATSPLTKT